ncbi:thioredoxin family protein [Roseibacterium sp. SDUM158016]|uniref:thioredoxin family protein n=1 Tax=Roseicyclus sediminis TaxID=2980997 RepID=UPI0021D26F44|nr:thioredoxin family protein [Roseibacterium sp. SDUM158016]MCU4651669.1 thioredoxin family protein [Roseibacterium sp. SDUM158016]
MTRREVFLGASALALLPHAASAEEMLTYTPGLPEQRLAAGETVLIDVSAPWCGTCRAQGRAIEALRGANPAYDGAITFIRMDWDTHGRSDYARSLGVQRRSTLILMRGDAILGQVVADTRTESIQALMDLALG